MSLLLALVLPLAVHLRAYGRDGLRHGGTIAAVAPTLAPQLAAFGSAETAELLQLEQALSSRVSGVPHASHTWAHVRLHVVAEAILRMDRVAEITGNGPCTAKFLARILHDALRLRSEPSYLWRPLPVENPSTRDV